MLISVSIAVLHFIKIVQMIHKLTVKIPTVEFITGGDKEVGPVYDCIQRGSCTIHRKHDIQPQ